MFFNENATEEIKTEILLGERLSDFLLTLHQYQEINRAGFVKPVTHHCFNKQLSSKRKSKTRNESSDELMWRSRCNFKTTALRECKLLPMQLDYLTHTLPSNKCLLFKVFFWREGGADTSVFYQIVVGVQ